MNVNKKGHVALAVTAGSAGLLMMPSLAMQTDAGIAAALVAAAESAEYFRILIIKPAR